MSDELAVLNKEVDKNRKVAKELAAKLEKGLQEQEQLVDRVRIASRVWIAIGGPADSRALWAPRLEYGLMRPPKIWSASSS